MKYTLAIAAGVAAIGLSGFAAAQQKFEMKVAYFVGDHHPLGAWFVRWSDGVEKASGGRITVKRFPGAQMGPPPGYYDMARTGQAEVTQFMHGGTPGRFPITELINLPYLVGSGDIGAKVLNDPELRTKYLDPEHKGIKGLVYFTVQPGQVMTTKKPIRTLEDFKGMRVRFSSPTIRDFITALGGTAVGVTPTELAEALQKGTVDGAFIDYGGAGIAFKLGGIVKHVSEMYSFVTSFGAAMNPDFYNKLPADLKKIIDDSMIGQAKELGDGIDSIDGPGKKQIVEGGANAFRLSPEEDAKFRKIGAEVAEAKIKEMEAKGLPARSAYTLMKSLADKHAKTSKNFWN
jgi:TRAP-type transport system periplasmic protein